MGAGQSMIKAWLTGLFALAITAPALAQNPPPPAPTLAERMAANRHAIAFENGRLSGPGAALLNRAMADAQFFMVGEQHGTATIAAISAALHREAAAIGYNHAAMEIGPNSGVEVERLIRSGPGRLAAQFRTPTYSFAVAFLFWAEEAALAEQFVALSRARSDAIWGLDQEFVGALPLLLPRLDALARTPAQRAALAALRARAAAEPMALAQMPAAELEPLRLAFETDAAPAAAPMVADLILSNAIYAPFTGRGGSGLEANLTRETYLKRNFLRRFEAAERAEGRPPHVFLKFGANHVMRGFSTTNVPSLGNFIAEWGLSRGFGAANIFINCVGGEQNDPRTGADSPCENELPADSPLHTMMLDAPLTLFDLRSLRSPRLVDGLDPRTRRIILAFDFYLAVRNPRAATPLAAPR